MGIQAVELFRQRPMNMENEWIYVTVLNACSHSSLIKEAQQIFHRIPDQSKTNKIYTTMVHHRRFIFYSLFIRWYLDRYS
jgi:hypothetical protein